MDRNKQKLDDDDGDSVEEKPANRREYYKKSRSSLDNQPERESLPAGTSSRHTSRSRYGYDNSDRHQSSVTMEMAHHNFSHKNASSDPVYPPVFERHTRGGMDYHGRLNLNRPSFMGHRHPFHMEHIAPEDDESANRTLFVGNVDHELTPADIKRIFERFGIVEEVKLKQSALETGNPYAFVRFFNLNQAHVAKMEMTGKFVGRVRSKIGYGRIIPTNCAWVGGIGPWLTKQELQQKFSKFGKIARFVWPREADYAYILYDNVQNATDAVQHMRGFMFDGTNVRLRMDYSDIDQVDNPPPKMNSYHSGDRAISRHDDSRMNARPGTKYKKSSSKTNSKSGRQRTSRGNTDDSSSQDSDSNLSSSNDEHSLSKRRNQAKRRKYMLSSESGNDSDASHTDRRFKRKDKAVQMGIVEEAGTISELARCLPVVWTGSLALKNTCFPMHMHLVSGHLDLVDHLLLSNVLTIDNKVLQITQRLRMDVPKLDEVQRKITVSGPHGWSMLLAMAARGFKQNHSKQGSLSELIAYLRDKKAAGVLSLPPNCKPGQESGLLHVFPPCKFAHDYLLEEAPKLMVDYNTEDYILVFLVRIKT
jgi:RNA-binding protein 15